MFIRYFSFFFAKPCRDIVYKYIIINIKRYIDYVSIKIKSLKKNTVDLVDC